MKSYTVHESPTPAEPDARLLLVREGFSWPAFLLPVGWLVFHRVWLGLPFYFAASLVCVAVVWLTGYDWTSILVCAGVLVMGPLYLLVLGDPLLGAVGLGVAYLIAVEANDLRRRWLAAEGYQLTDVVSGKSLSEAERALFAVRGLPAEGAPAPDHVAPGEPILGLFARRRRAS